MGKELSPLRKWASRYRKTITNAIWNDLTIAFVCTALPAVYRIKDIEGGEYPGQAAAEISRRVAELKPGIITEAVVGFLVILLVLFVPILLYRFWFEHRINLIKKLAKAELLLTIKKKHGC
ncbi:MAG: hypothetical protein NC123_00095 [Butyrivibrio sp.]|nr:hypothetical protein [Acetatifactor muris]MCM1557934.1 hypothetical protein [Butyrivibrio sp.]